MGKSDGTLNIETLNNPAAGGIFTIDELLHVALKGPSRFSDDMAYADAVADVAGEDRPIWSPWDESKPVSASNIPTGNQASRYWHDHLHQACGYPSSVSNGMTEYRLFHY